MPSISKQFYNNLLNYEDKANNGNNIGSVFSQKSELCLLLYGNGDGVAQNALHPCAYQTCEYLP